MIKGPFPLSTDKTHYEIPLASPLITPKFNGERVALHVSREDWRLVTPGVGYKGTVTDLDTGRRYALFGMPCEADCACDAEIFDVE